MHFVWGLRDLSYMEKGWPSSLENNKYSLFQRRWVNVFILTPTVSPVSTRLPKPERSGSSFAAHVILMVSAVMLLVVLLPFFICCLEKTKGKTEDSVWFVNRTLLTHIELWLLVLNVALPQVSKGFMSKNKRMSVSCCDYWQV